MKNPPAFPRPHSIDPHSADRPRTEHAQEGMSLRDYFAAMAMQGLLAKKGGYTDDVTSPEAHNLGLSEKAIPVDTVAAYAYWQADAMLAERAK